VLDTPLGRWGTLICLDRQLPEAARILALRGARVVLVPSYGGYGEMNDLMLRTRAYENGVWLVFVHPKRCLIIDPRGRITAQDDPAGGDQVIAARVALGREIGGGPIRNRRPELYRELLGKAVARERAAELTVAGLQMMPERWGKEANFRKLERFAHEAAGRGANVIVTPESFLDGYVANDKANRPFASPEKYFGVGEAIDGPLLERVRRLAGELKVWLAAGFAERRGDRMYNSVALFSPAGALALRYSKTHTANDEPYNTKGTKFPVTETPLGRWGTLICMDRQLPETSRILAVKGAQLILIPAWGSYNETNDIMMRTRAYENGVWLAFVHPNRCLIVDPRGNIAAQNIGEGEQIVTARVQLSGGPERSPIRFRRPEIYGEILK
jgi:predicted amidohydrolase